MKLVSKNPHFFDELSQIRDSFPNLTAVELDKTDNSSYESDLHTKICVAENLENIDTIQNIADSKCHVLIHKENRDFLKDFKRSAMLCEHKEDYFLHPERLFFEGPARVVKVPFQSTVDKGNVLIEVDNYCNLLNSTFLTESLQAIFEELFMNAVFDAPREAGTPEDISPAELFMGDDGTSLVISCLDRYGSLIPDKFFKRILQIEKHGAGQVMNMNSSVGGAGIGCSILFGCSATLIVGVLPGKYTRVSCVIPLKMSRMKFSQIKKNIHLVVCED